MKNDINISLVPYESDMSDTDWNLDRIIYDLDANKYKNNQKNRF